MKGLADPDRRRGLRALVEALVALGLVALLWWITALLAGDGRALVGVAQGALAIVALGTLFYGMENVTRAFRIQVGPTGVEAEAGPDTPQP